MKTKMRILFATIATYLLTFGSVSTYAASDGTLGLTSQGSVDITVGVGDRVQISGLDDIALGQWSGSGNLTGDEELCVYSSTSKYEVTISGLHASNSFALSAGGTTTLPYTVNWADDPGDATYGNRGVTEGTPLTGNVGNNTHYTCGGATNATLRVYITEANLQAAVAGNYSDTLTINVSPE
jgi:hypothetical protein